MGLLDIFRVSKIKQENEQLKAANMELQNKFDSLGIDEYYQAREKIDALTKESNEKLAAISREIASKNTMMAEIKKKLLPCRKTAAGLKSRSPLRLESCHERKNSTKALTMPSIISLIRCRVQKLQAEQAGF